MWTYEPFRIWYVKTHKKAVLTDIVKETKLSRQTVTKIWNDKPVMSTVIERLCEVYNLPVEQVCQYKKEEE